MKNNELDDKMIGRRIYFARHDQLLSINDLAQMTNLSAAYIRQIERGSKRCSLESLVRICAALELSVDYILFGINSENEKITIICDYLENSLRKLRPTPDEPLFLK